jgi:hypothetical protein
MSLFGKILEKLGLRKEKEEEKPAAAGTTAAVGAMPHKPEAAAPTPKPAAPAKPAAPKPATGTGTRTTGMAERGVKDDIARQPAASVAAPAAPKPISEVDVMNMLEQKAKGTGLNWKQSISDLLFLLDIDNSYNARVELAKELDAPQEVMGDSARMNTWLHKTVLRKIAENGGNIPQDLLD